MAKEAIFIPGHDATYPLTCAKLREGGFAVTEIMPNWKQSFEKLVTQVSHDLRRKIGSNSLIIAHSFGVNVALPEISQHPGIGLVVASPSVACAEGCEYEAGLNVIERSFPGQSDVVRRFSLAALAKAVQTPPERVAVLVGQAEAQKFPYMGELAQLAAQSLGVEVTSVPTAPHFIEYSAKYVQAVADAAARISNEMG